MASLQDQLLKAGMVDAKKAKRLEKEKRKQAKKVRRGEAERDDQTKIAAQNAQAEKRENDRKSNQHHQQLAEKKAIAAQITQLVQSHRIDHCSGDIRYQFADGKKIKSIDVDATQQRQLERGVIGVVALNGCYELVGSRVAEKIAQRDQDAVVVLNERPATTPGAELEDDPYADFQIPDDLMW